MFRIEGKALYDDEKHIATLVPRYMDPYGHGNPISVKIITHSELRPYASPHFLKALRKFVREQMNTSTAIVDWF